MSKEDIEILEEIIKGNEDCIEMISKFNTSNKKDDEDIRHYEKEIQSIKNTINSYKREKARADKLEKEYSKMLTKIDEYEVEKQQDKDRIQELGEINFNLLNNGVPKELFRELQEKLKKEKNENEANKKRIKELEEELEKSKLKAKVKKIAEQYKDKARKIAGTYQYAESEEDLEDKKRRVIELRTKAEALEELLKDGGK